MQAVKTYIKRIQKLNRPAVTVLALCLALVTLNLCIAQHTYSYDSDDVSWQTTLLTWSPFSGQTAYVGARDNFFINMPFIFFFEHLFHMSRTQLLAEAIFFALVNFTLFYIACLYFMKKAGVRLTFFTLVPFIWLASFGSGLATSFLNTNWRDYEFGVSFIFYMIAAKYYYGDISLFTSLRSKLATAALLIFAALYTYSDPYFYYFTLAPIALLFGYLWLTKRISQMKAAVAVTFCLLALVGSRAFTSFFARIGIIAPHGAITLTSPGTFHQTVNILLSNVGNIFSIDFSKNVLVSLSNVTLLAVILFLVLTLHFGMHRRKAAGERALAMKIFFKVLAIGSIVAYLAVGNATPGNGRYLVLFVYVSTLLIAVNMNRFGWSTLRALVIALLITAALNTTAAFSQVQDSRAVADGVNSNNYQLIGTLKRLGYTKGYANYWDSNINTYLSENTVDFLPVVCGHGETRPLPLLVNGDLFKQPATKTFLIVDPSYTQPRMCRTAQMLDQFGQPSRTIVMGKDTILLYNYDLVTQMPDTLR